MIFLLCIDRPDIVPLANQVSYRVYGSEHRMVLIVVAMQTVATDGLEIREVAEIEANRVNGLPIVMIVDWIGLAGGQHRAIFDLGGLNQTDAGAFFDSSLNQALGRPTPLLALVRKEILKPEGSARRIGHHRRAPVFIILDAPDRDLR